MPIEFDLYLNIKKRNGIIVQQFGTNATVLSSFLFIMIIKQKKREEEKIVSSLEAICLFVSYFIVTSREREKRKKRTENELIFLVEFSFPLGMLF